MLGERQVQVTPQLQVADCKEQSQPVATKGQELGRKSHGQITINSFDAHQHEAPVIGTISRLQKKS
jgi:hypothetical protein